MASCGTATGMASRGTPGSRSGVSSPGRRPRRHGTPTASTSGRPGATARLGTAGGTEPAGSTGSGFPASPADPGRGRRGDAPRGTGPLRPALQLDDVALGIGDVGPGHVAAVRGLGRDDVADGTTTFGKHDTPGFLDVGDLERDVAEARSVRLGRRMLERRLVLVDLERRAAGPDTRQSEVDAPKRGVRDPGARREHRTAVVALGR